MWSLALLVAAGFAATTPTSKSKNAITCIRDFLEKYEHSSSYSTRMKKTEFDFGEPFTENVEIREKNKSEIELIFVDNGRTGIKNNGMSVKYTGGDQVVIELGHSRGLGLLINGIAEAFTFKKKKLFDSDVIEDQIFTVNRAGFGFLARTLRQRLTDLENGSLGSLSLDGPACKVRFRAKRKFTEIALAIDHSIFDLEEKYSTLAYVIFKDNQEQFDSFKKLFDRKEAKKIRISAEFTDFNLDLNDQSLPDQVEVFWNNRILGRYEFNNTTIN